MSRKQYIFGYGSLVCPDDIFRTLGHAVDLRYPARLNGWIRDWSVVIDNTSTHRGIVMEDGGPAPGCIVVLNVRRPATDESPTNPNGVLFEVTGEDLAKMDERESHYSRQDVSGDIIADEVPGTVYAYVGLDRFLSINDNKMPVVIPGSYYDLVTEGFASLGPEMRDMYMNSTLASSLPVHGSMLKG